MRVDRPLEIEPVTRVMYWNKDLEKEWVPKLQRIRNAYYKAELETVLSGMRRVYVYHVNSKDFDKSYRFLRDNGLVFFPTNQSAVYEGFSHKHRPVKPGDVYTLYGAAVRSDDMEAGELFEQASVGNITDHGIIGDLLGYPKCCVDFFNETWYSVSIDPMFEAALNTPGAEVEDIPNGKKVTVECHPYVNNMLRYFGARITPHLPHQMQCKDTIAWGKKWIKIMKKVDKKASEWAIELLSMPLTWNCYKAVTIIDTDIFRAITNSDPTLTYKIVENRGWEGKL